MAVDSKLGDFLINLAVDGDFRASFGGGDDAAKEAMLTAAGVSEAGCVAMLCDRKDAAKDLVRLLANVNNQPSQPV